MPSQEICIEKIESLRFKNCVCVCEGGGHKYGAHALYIHNNFYARCILHRQYMPRHFAVFKGGPD